MQSSAENNPVFLLLYSLKNVSLPKPLMGDKKIYSQYRSLADNRQGKQDCQGFPPYLCHRNHTCSKGTKQRQNILKGNNLSLNSYVWHKKVGLSFYALWLQLKRGRQDPYHAKISPKLDWLSLYSKISQVGK